MSEKQLIKSRHRGKYRGASVSRGEKRGVGRLWLWRSVVFAATLTGVSFGGLKALEVYHQVNQQTMEVVRIEGNINQETEDQIRRVMARFMDQSLIQIDLADVRGLLLEEPWIDTVELRREWPETIVVKIEEQVPVARWGEAQLLNQRGLIFSPGELGRYMALPVLTGPSGMELEVMTQYQKFTQLLYPLGLRIISLNLNNRRAWQLILDNEVIVNVGKDNLMEKMRRFVALSDSQFMNQMVQIKSIDLRYRNGISVSNKPQENEEVVSL